MSNSPIFNMWVACSNVFCIFPIVLSYVYEDWFTFKLLVNLSLASFFSHLFECHKFDMPGFPMVGQRGSFILNQWDVASYWILALHLACQFFSTHKGDYRVMELMVIIAKLAVPINLSVLPNILTSNPSLQKHVYLIAHPLWHLSIFLVIFDILSTIYKQ